MKKGLLLINLGTPKAPTPKEIRRYLAEFLTDKRVIALPFFIRYPLVYLGILPFRPQKTAKAYQAIWTKDGSPLLIHSKNLETKLKELLPDWEIALGMRYGEPSLESALEQLKNCESLCILPLYPQYSKAATGSSIAKVLQLISKWNYIPHLNIIADFYKDDFFIKASASLIKPYLTEDDYLLLSYHGIPENHLQEVGCHKVCEECNLQNFPPLCYKAQCYKTTDLIAKELHLNNEKIGLSFQSRLGKTPWIKPYTDEILQELRQQGIKNLVVFSPSFTADCLETLEEIGIRAKQQWQALGGEKFTLVHCLNDNPMWVEGLVQKIEDLS
ncbi:MAG: ferrochelatase [Proteobacteria bacterium]|nr:ferrochelatase [Pseudomonadota bacterium]